MAISIPHEIREAAASRGVCLRSLREVFAELRSAANRELEPLVHARCMAWREYNSGVWRGTSRQSMKLKYRRAFEGGDMTLVPRFDEVAERILAEHPWLGDAQGVWDLLCQEKPSPPNSEKHWWQAIELCDARDAVPF